MVAMLILMMMMCQPLSLIHFGLPNHACPALETPAYFPKVSEIKRHPGWRSAGFLGYPNDIALLKLSSAIDLNSRYASVISLADSGEEFVNDGECWITGWGSTGRSNPDILQVC